MQFTSKSTEFKPARRLTRTMRLAKIGAKDKKLELKAVQPAKA